MKLEYKYLVNCELGLERDANYKGASEVQALFEATDKDIEGCGNLCSDVAINAKTHKASWNERGYLGKEETHIGLYRAIPSALLMYRLACLFPGSIKTEGSKGYKVVWQFNLIHKPTGTQITFGEWKGASLFWTKFYGCKDKNIPDGFLKDVQKLISYLVSKNAAHPYDGLIAGSVA